MNVDANLKSISNIGISQQVSTNNIVNAQSNDFQAHRVVQSADKVSISPEARLAAQNNAGENMSTTDVAQDIVQTTINEATLSANIKAIQTQDQMDQALFSIKK
ncbi:MAG: hypothetical protein COC22_01690 [Flavobacteriaceae bacterium]|nr:MAG: hypothetical protein COC22_01690 [Flavobacteriaceae bacterium]